MTEVAAVDKQGQIYIAGMTDNTFQTTKNAFQPTYPTNFIFPVGFLLKLDPSATTILYATFLNGLQPTQLVVDDGGNIYVLANHQEKRFDQSAIYYPAPITPNAVQKFAGTEITPTLLKIAPSGDLIYATFLGGTYAMAQTALTVDSRGAAVVCGATADRTLPTSPGAYQTVLHRSQDVFVARLSPDGNYYEALTLLGADGIDRCAGVQLDLDGNIAVFGDTTSRFFPVTPGAYQTTRGAGVSLFAAKLDSSLQRLLWSTYIGGAFDTYAQKYVNLLPRGTPSLALAADGGLVFTARTLDHTFPVGAGSTPPPLWKTETPVFGVLDSTGSRLAVSSTLPVEGAMLSIATADGKSFWMTGTGNVGELSLNSTLNAQGLNGFLEMGGVYTFPFVARMELPSGQITYLGPLREINGLALVPFVGLAAAPNGDAILTGLGWGDYAGWNAPLHDLRTNPDTGSVVFALNLSGQRSPLVASVVNAASLVPCPLSAGEVIEVRGAGFATSPTSAPDPANPPLELGGVRVTVDGAAIPLLSVTETSAIAVVPAGFNGPDSSMLAVESATAKSDLRAVRVTASSPAVFATNLTGVGQALAFNQDGSANGWENPARKGDSIRLIVNGLGTSTVDGEGRLATNASLMGTIGDVAAMVNKVLVAPGYPNGYVAVDVVIPDRAPAGDFVLVSVAADGIRSQEGVTVAIR